MSEKYVSQIALAKRLIAAKGQKVIWRKLPTTAGGKPWRPSDAPPVEYEVDIVFLPRDRTDTQLIRANSDSVQIGNIYGLMAAVEFSPNSRDVVIRDGKECRIFAIDVLAPDGTPILYTIDFDL